MDKTLSAIAPAKVNLFLHVIGKREDGYHDLESAVIFSDKGDIVHVQPAENLLLNISGPFAEAVPANKTNLVWKAARTLQTHFGITTGAEISLEKHLPVASGIGGGSSDTAAAAKLLCNLWDIKVELEELGRILLPLGADIPACLYARPLLMKGLGEKIIPLQLDRNYGLLLCNPLKPVITKNIFKTLTSYDASLTDIPSPLSASFLKNHTYNVLTSSASKAAPEITSILAMMGTLEQVVFARMSGSGATCFALFESEEYALSAEKKLKEKWPQYWMQASRINHE